MKIYLYRLLLNAIKILNSFNSKYIIIERTIVIKTKLSITVFDVN